MPRFGAHADRMIRAAMALVAVCIGIHAAEAPAQAGTYPRCVECNVRSLSSSQTHTLSHTWTQQCCVHGGDTAGVDPAQPLSVALPALADPARLYSYIHACALDNAWEGVRASTRTHTRAPKPVFGIQVDFHRTRATHTADISAVDASMLLEPRCDVGIDVPIYKYAPADALAFTRAGEISRIIVNIDFLRRCTSGQQIPSCPLFQSVPEDVDRAVQQLEDAGWHVHGSLSASAYLSAGTLAAMLVRGYSGNATLCMVDTAGRRRQNRPQEVGEVELPLGFYLDVAVAHCKEDVSWITGLRSADVDRVFVYTKCGAPVPQQSELNDGIALNVTVLPNAGGEEYAYLVHMQRALDEAKALQLTVPEQRSRIIAFLQGSPTGHQLDVLTRVTAVRKKLIRNSKSHWMLRASGFAYLDDDGARVGFDACPQHCGLPVGEFYEDLVHQPYPAYIGVRWGGQFLASLAAVHQFGEPRIAEMLSRIDPHSRFPNAFIVERMWHVLFGLNPDYEAALVEVGVDKTARFHLGPVMESVPLPASWASPCA